MFQARDQRQDRNRAFSECLYGRFERRPTVGDVDEDRAAKRERLWTSRAAGTTFRTNGLGSLGRRWAPGLPGALLLSGESFHAPVGELGKQYVERPIRLSRPKDLETDRPRHQVGQLQSR
jgi:hypothetical protein